MKRDLIRKIAGARQIRPEKGKKNQNIRDRGEGGAKKSEKDPLDLEFQFSSHTLAPNVE